MANPRKLRLIYRNDSKSDRVDAQYLARIGRLDPALLAPFQHRQAAPKPISPSFAAGMSWCGPALGLSTTSGER